MNYINKDEIRLNLKVGSQIKEILIIESGNYFEYVNDKYRVMIDGREFEVTENFIENYEFIDAN